MSHLIALIMKTKKLFSMLAIALMMAISTPLLGDVPQERTYDLGEVTISCSGHGYGPCHLPGAEYERNYGDLMEYRTVFRCYATGDPNHSCHWILWALFRAYAFWFASF
jgi:hypothetical protein